MSQTFRGIIGQNVLKLGLILNIIDPKIGGVCLFGDRGTGKSRSIRVLNQVLPLTQFWGKNFKIYSKTRPVLELPLGATEDRVCGTIDIERALSTGVKSFEPGLLKRANGGIMYVDEINLLDDHLVDMLLDSAASGWNTVERESISVRHPANFILVGSGNPEEGALRPQLLDRFGLNVTVKRPRSARLRSRIIKRLRSNYKNLNASKLKKRIELARYRHVNMSSKLKNLISEICSNLKIDGLRGDLVINRAACAYAGFFGRNFVKFSDLKVIIPIALTHRLQKNPLEKVDSSIQILESLKSFDKDFSGMSYNVVSTNRLGRFNSGSNPLIPKEK